MTKLGCMFYAQKNDDLQSIHQNHHMAHKWGWISLLMEMIEYTDEERARYNWYFKRTRKNVAITPRNICA